MRCFIKRIARNGNDVAHEYPYRMFYAHENQINHLSDHRTVEVIVAAREVSIDYGIIDWTEDNL